MTRTTASRPAIDSDVARHARPAGLPVARGGGGVEVLGDPVGVDDRDEPVDQDDEVEHEDRHQDARVDEEPEQRDPVDAQDDPGAEREQQDRRRPRRPGRAAGRRHTAGRGRGRSGRGMPRRTATSCAVARPAGSCIAGRIHGAAETGSRDARPSPCGPEPTRRPHLRPRGRMFRPVESKPDFVAQEHEILDGWRDRRTFARLRAQNAGGPKWSFLDGPITANNPMGVHHAWGRAYKDLYQRFHAMLGEDQRYQNGFDCQGLWVEVNVERDLGFTSQARHRGVRDRPVRDPVQAARPDLRRAPDRAVDPARDVDGLERPGRAAPAARPARHGPRGRSRPSRARTAR